MTTNTCLIKSVKDLDKYIVYLLNEDKHKNQVIIHNDVLEKTNYLLSESNIWKQTQESKKGHRPKPLSIVLSFPAGTSKNDFIKKALEKLHLWIRKISAIEDLNLDDNDIERIVRSIPYVAHYKESNPHVHFLFPKIFPKYNFDSKTNKNTVSLEYINIYKFKYTNILYNLSGWNIKEKVLHKKQEEKIKKSTSSTVYLKDKLFDEIDKYKGLNDKLDKFIILLEKDLEKGHTEKAIKKLEKIKRRND
jgi:hypothetical protein